MIGFFGKKEELKVPKNLPELAKDNIEGNENNIEKQSKEIKFENTENQIQKEINKTTDKNFLSEKDYKKIIPSSNNVPKFDISMLKDRLNYNKDNDEVVNYDSSIKTDFKQGFSEINNINVKENVEKEKYKHIILHSSNAINFTEYIEKAISNGDFNLAKDFLNNFHRYLYQVHNAEKSPDIAQLLSQLKNLEVLWMLLQEKSKSVNNVISILESDMNNVSRDVINVLNDKSEQKKGQYSEEPISFRKSDNKTHIYDSDKPPLVSPVFIPIKNFEEKQLSPNERFYFNNGLIASNLRELYNILSIISDDVFYYHVNSEKNDFANWIRDVLKNYGLADKIYGLKTRSEILSVLKDGLQKETDKI